VNVFSWLRKSAPKTCTGCGHERGPHRHYRRGSDCALCRCPRWQRARRRRYSATELADLSRDIPEWPYAKPSAEWDRTWRAITAGDADLDTPPTSCDPYVVRDPQTPQQGEQQR
jgi:hypothetical protein